MERQVLEGRGIGGDVTTPNALPPRWMQLGFATEEDMLDWLENNPRQNGPGLHRRGGLFYNTIEHALAGLPAVARVFGVVATKG
jgi:hypothetical protein